MARMASIAPAQHCRRLQAVARQLGAAGSAAAPPQTASSPAVHGDDDDNRDYHSRHPGVARHSTLYTGDPPPRHPSDRQEPYATMTPRERYLFDLQGFVCIRTRCTASIAVRSQTIGFVILIRPCCLLYACHAAGGLLNAEEVARMNEAFDANPDRLSEFGEAIIPQGAALSGSHGSLRQWHGLLSFPQPHCQPFRDLLCHVKLIPYLNTLLGRGWRINCASEQCDSFSSVS